MKIKYIETQDGQRWLASEALAHVVAMKPTDAKAEIIAIFGLAPEPTKTTESEA